VTEPSTISAQDVLRFAVSQGPGRDAAAEEDGPQPPLTTSFGTLPERVATDRMVRLAWGTVDLLEDAAFPGPCGLDPPSDALRWQHAMVMAFGLQHREPSNLFNDHRSCASVRSKFPVHAFVHTARRAWLLDVYRHGLLPVDDACPVVPSDEPISIALAGRYTHLPSLYGRLRGPLTELELGISLRSLWVALDVFGLSGELHLPGLDAGRLMGQLGLDPPGQWSAPLSVAIDHDPCSPGERAPAPSAPAAWPDPVPQTTTDWSGRDDPTLVEAVAVNRASLATAHPASDCRLAGARAIPTGVATGADSWGEVLWQRSAGRMPRHLSGFSGRRTPVPASAVNDAVAWLQVPPPAPVLAEVGQRLTVTACIQDADGFATGHYRLELQGLRLVHADASLPARMERCYGNGQGPSVGCALRHANMVWLLSADVAALVDAFGPGAWTLAQQACGWMAHGLCLSAAAHRLYARPSRAFDDGALRPLVGLAASEMVLLSIVSGMARFTEPTLDLRS
jgi:hypothetical protein